MLAEITHTAIATARAIAIPSPSVASELRVANAAAPAPSAANTLGSVHAAAAVGGPVTIMGTISAVSIAAGTNLSARASSGGSVRCANTAMNERRDR